MGYLWGVGWVLCCCVYSWLLGGCRAGCPCCLVGVVLVVLLLLCPWLLGGCRPCCWVGVVLLCVFVAAWCVSCWLWCCWVWCCWCCCPAAVCVCCWCRPCCCPCLVLWWVKGKGKRINKNKHTNPKYYIYHL